MSKPRMTKNRVSVLAKIENNPLFLGAGEQGGKEYFWGDGSRANPNVIGGMLNCGLLLIVEGPLGPGQEIVRA